MIGQIQRSLLPYILHDGIINPRVYSIPDRQNLGDMIHRAKTLSVAYYFTDNPKYAYKAEGLLRVWFLNNNTRMNPNLQYAEMEPGKNNVCIYRLLCLNFLLISIIYDFAGVDEFSVA
jgi:Alginate lyase